MGDVISSHLDEAKRERISGRCGEVMVELGRVYERQFAVSLFNKVRFDIEGGGGPQPQLLHRKVPLENRSIFSGSIFQFLEENRKWRNRFLFVPDSYNIHYYDNKTAHDKRLPPKGVINCAGYKVLTSLDEYLELISNSLPGVKAKVGSAPFLKLATAFPLFLYHPYAKHHCFCLASEPERHKWSAVLQDCVRHANDGLSEENKVQTPAFTDAVRLYRQAEGHYGTWEMMCGTPTQILSNLVMETLLPELRDLIAPKLKGKLHDRQRNWILISDAVYSLVQADCESLYQTLLQRCEASRSVLEASIRTDMDQIITSKEHVTNKIRAVVVPKAEKLLKVSIQPYISSILDALMEPTSRGFFEVRDVFFRELVDMSKNCLNQGAKEAVAQHMEKISMLAFHPVKMQSCYEKVEPLSLEGLQQRFDVSSPSVFVQRAQILMREQMDDAVYTFEQILHQSLEAQGSEDLCKTIQRCQDRVIKKFDYDSSTVRKRFFREALLQIFIPYMLKQLNPTVSPELPRFQELIFEDFSRFILVENIFEEVVLHSVMKDITMAVKEAAVQRRHNLYRDSIVLSNSDPSLHLLGENPSIDWAEEYGGATEEKEEEKKKEGEEEVKDGDGGDAQKRKRMKQVVSMIQVDGAALLPGESCLEVPGVDDIPEEEEEEEEEDDEGSEESAPKASDNPPEISNGSITKVEESEKAAKSGGSSPPVEEKKSVPATSPEPSECLSGTSNGSLVVGGQEKPQEEEKKEGSEKAANSEPSEASTVVSNGPEVTLEEANEEVKESDKGGTKELDKGQAKDESKGESNGEVNGQVKESVKGEPNQDAKESANGEAINSANGEATESDKGEAKELANGEAKESDKGKAKESVKDDAKGEANAEPPPKASAVEVKPLTAETCELSNGSVDEPKDDVPPNGEAKTASAKEKQEEKASTAETTDTKSGLSNGSGLTEATSAEVPSEAEQEDANQKVEDLPSSNQEESDEILPPPPPPEDNTPSETSPEGNPEDFPAPPSSEEVEEVLSAPSSGEKEATVAAEAKPSDSESKDQ